jgi:hypothetical protein
VKIEPVPFASIKQKLLNHWKLGASPGVYCGFENLHDYYSMKPGSVTDWTGFPTSGKTQFLLELLINTSEFYGWKHILFMPDAGDPVEVYADLIHKVSGKTFDKNYPNYIREEEIYRHETFVSEHFLVVEKKSFKSDLSPIDFWEFVAAQKDYHTGVVDSWKNLRHDMDSFGGRDDKYLDYVLPIRNEIAERSLKHFHTVIHPVKTEITNGKRRVPNAYDLKGGGSWFDNGKSIITVDRPDRDSNQVDIYISKAKPRVVGKQGWTSMFFDWEKSRYYNESDGYKTYGTKNKVKAKPTVDFSEPRYKQDLPF